MARLKFTGLEEGKKYEDKNNKYDTYLYQIKNGELIAMSKWSGLVEKVHFGNWDIDSMLEAEFVEVKSKIKLTETQRDILKGKIAEGYNWIARDKDDDINFYTENPSKDDAEWWMELGGEYAKSRMEFDFLSWEDEEPTNIKEFLGEE